MVIVTPLLMSAYAYCEKQRRSRVNLSLILDEGFGVDNRTTHGEFFDTTKHREGGEGGGEGGGEEEEWWREDPEVPRSPLATVAEGREEGTIPERSGWKVVPDREEFPPGRIGSLWHRFETLRRRQTARLLLTQTAVDDTPGAGELDDDAIDAVSVGGPLTGVRAFARAQRERQAARDELLRRRISALGVAAVDAVRRRNGGFEDVGPLDRKWHGEEDTEDSDEEERAGDGPLSGARTFLRKQRARQAQRIGALLRGGFGRDEASPLVEEWNHDEAKAAATIANGRTEDAEERDRDLAEAAGPLAAVGGFLREQRKRQVARDKAMRERLLAAVRNARQGTGGRDGEGNNDNDSDGRKNAAAEVDDATKPTTETRRQQDVLISVRNFVLEQRRRQVARDRALRRNIVAVLRGEPEQVPTEWTAVSSQTTREDQLLKSLSQRRGMRSDAAASVPSVPRVPIQTWGH